MRKFSARLAGLLLCLWAPLTLHAQTARTITDGYDDAIKGAQTVAALGPDMFGEQVNLQDGATSFRALDVSIKTNSGLPMSVGRVLGINARDTDRYTDWARDGELFGNWKLDVPVISGTYDERTGWVSSMTNPKQRCSVSYSAASPPAVYADYSPWGNVVYYPEQYWSGNTISIPGKGAESLLYLPAERTRPADGRTYYGITKSDWRVACVPARNDPGGEGFLVVLPDGTKYTFDWMSSRRVSALKDTICAAEFGCLTQIVVNRREYFLHATKVEDRFGNWVTYTYDSVNPRLLRSMASSDGAAITLTYVGDKVDTITAAGRTWQYLYTDSNRTSLSAVVLPDNSRWSFQYGDLYQLIFEMRVNRVDCEPIGVNFPGMQATVAITHPSGALGTYTFQRMLHGTDRTPGGCSNPPDQPTQESLSEIVEVYKLASLVSKTVTGPGLTTSTWSYVYQPSWSWNVNGYEETCTPPFICDATTETRVTGPDNTVTRYVFGNDYFLSKGQLLQVDVISGVATVQSTTTAYVADLTGMPFPDRVGYDPFWRNNKLQTEKLRPQRSTAMVRDGVTFTHLVNSFDVFARSLSVTKSSTLGYSKTDTTEYHDDLTAWVLGQVKRSTTNGIETARTDFDPRAQPWKTYAFGKLQDTLGYWAEGTLATVTDGRGYTTQLSGWKRGIPQQILHPATPEAPGGATESAIVNDAGWITAVTDENGYATGYGHDAMGRLASIAYPEQDSTVWNITTLTFAPSPTAKYGLPIGHWQHTFSTGLARKVTYYDAMWRPLVEEAYDDANQTGTRSVTVKRYDAAGRAIFQSYPLRTLGDYATVSQGVDSEYDALDRVTAVRQDSELGVLSTTTQYLSGFQTRVTSPRGQSTGASTTTSYMAYDQPSTDLPVAIAHPEGAYTSISRDVFGKPLQLSRHNANHSVSNGHNYSYDQYQQLCKRSEPETGTTAFGYDSAGNPVWSASGLTWSPGPACDYTFDNTAARRVDRTYDARNRVMTLRFPDGRGNQDWTYFADGLPNQVTTTNIVGVIQAINTYVYNKRRQLTGEALSLPSWYHWSLGYGFDGNGNLASQTYPSGLNVNYAPNALGQATQAGSYATGVSYHPNGAIAGFTYGNGIVHTMIPNAYRPLPERSTDGSGMMGSVLDDSYDFDANGNVVAISDGLPGARGNRDMTYDGLDRLATTTSPMFNGTVATYSYDVLDNLKSVRAPGRDHTYVYDGSQRLTNVTNTVGGQSVIGLGYDVQGNLANKNGQLFDFDYGNRLREAINQERYRYDAHGRRILAMQFSVGTILSQYGQAGQLLYQSNGKTNKTHDYIYLGGSLLATRDYDVALGTFASKYQHTDALGSPVAVTDQNRTVIERSEYEPYGKVINRIPTDGPGYTGHVFDAATGLNYMQQRYYDPGIGRFLSVDPVTANGNTGANFNRYWYANNNPYKFVDPDGRIGVVGFLIGAGIDATVQVAGNMRSGQDFGEAVSNIDVGDVVAAGAVSAIIPGLGNLAKTGYQSAKAIGPAAKAIQKIADKSANTANRAAKNAEGTARNIGKIEKATADVGKATVTAGVHQVVKAEAQSRTPETKASEVREVIKPPPPPPPPDEMRHR